MKVFVRSAWLICLFIGLLTACKKPVPKQIKLIPKGASFVVDVNGGTLKNKLKESEGDIENILKNMSGEGDTALDKGKKEWQDIKAAGIDMDDHFYFWAIQKGGNGGAMNTGNAIISAMAGLNDEGKFEAYIKKKLPGTSIQKEKDFSYVTKDGDKMVAWGKDVVIMLNYQKAYAGGMDYDSATGNYNLQAPAQANLVNDLKAQMIACFSQKESESVASITEFRNLVQEKSDASLWANPGSSIDDMMLPLPKLKELLQNNYTAATLQFDDGKVVVNSKSYTSKAMSDIFEKYAGPKVNLDLVQKFPSNNINGFMVFAFNPQIINAVVRYLEVGGLVDGYLTKFMGSTYTLQDMLKAFKGDIAVTVSDFNIARGDTILQGVRTLTAPSAKMVFTMPLGDKTQINKLMDRLVEMKMLEKVNGVYKPAGASQAFGLTAAIDDKNLTIASDGNLLAAYAAGKSKAIFKKGVLDDFDGKAGAAYFDIESFLAVLSSANMGSSPNNEPLQYAKETFKDVKAYLSNYNGRFTEGHMELRFKDEKANSLASLLKLASRSSNVAPGNHPAALPKMAPADSIR